MNTKKRAMEDEEDFTVELGGLCPDVIRTIFSRIPLKPLIKLKRVSTTWRDFITDFRRRNPPTTDGGLAVILCRVPVKENSLYEESIFLPPHKKRRRNSTRRHNDPLFLIGSCNGLLLYRGGGDGGEYPYYIQDHFHDRCITLPRVHERTRLTQAGLAFDGFGSNFQVVWFFYKEVDFEKGLMNCKIFSSEKWEWREFGARIHNIGLVIENGFNQEPCFLPSLYFDGRIYWIWSICMLQYDTGNETFKLFSLPTETNGNGITFFAQLLYESDGQIYFCHNHGDSLRIFSFVVGDDDEYEWKLRRSVSKQECIHQKLDWSDFWSRVRPCAFNQDLQELILFVPPRRIVSYSLETGEFAPVWFCEGMEGHILYVRQVLPLLFKSVHLFEKDNCSSVPSSELFSVSQDS